MNSSVVKEKLFINGQWVETKNTQKIYNKYTGELFAEVCVADESLVDQAIGAAVHAYKQTVFAPDYRYTVLMRTAELLKENIEEFARIIAQEGGKPITDAKAEVNRSVSTIQMAADETKKLVGEIIPNYNHQGRFLYTVKKPIGVIAAITPFNFPLNLVVHKVAPALAAGNPVILKPASTTATIAVKLCELLEKAGVPKGYVQCVVGSGSTVGEQLLKDERIAHYTFTGSPEVGKHINRTIGLRKATLELGSNSATIVHSDADVEKAASKLAKMAFAHAGQICISVQRIFVQESVKEKFMEKFLHEVSLLKVGDPLNPETNVGPMISEKEAERIELWVKEALDGGAEILSGGKREKNVYYPTVITNARKGMKVVDEEAFAPIVVVSTYETINEAIELVNDSKYGLQAGIYTSDLNLSYKIPYLLEVGGIIVNDTCCFRTDQMPYGGVKESGNGKEGPSYAIQELVETVTVVVNLEG
ncbi:aldehyde dehydrogenase family protein [Schinkia azotoformans]|uniref:Aldehyde dehydrogenase (NAD) family protein n=1 Tax=Schinkia azotoformans LMG 9581 TaxID=1131731 RepID=K6D5C5_SCHAZ|nr:aldehyde dehydrogenase family protein [Schinkia azotoformans]EKN63253.1 aldehyde dehydrogenase (NAD) family protein [Schinkia azotoformans LMG 9581]MEC1637197.1 aldehyde dehydrogenase family protein [Schinkia azotoformans]MEC1720645.1 aldehyde dehydrogenase family protein [Schinkia azotoformans]MEC1943601.1 aldehyde dehydrogenase family protein [Schinkia azotoformans]MED4411784.1 aldehyde dehydrogenase family protein [Schinkia azotoformans]